MAFTDGSTKPGSGQCGGFGVVVCLDGSLEDTRSVRGTVKRSGGNYLAEATAILACLLSVPANVNLAIWSDCLSAIQAVEKKDPCEAARLRMAARPVLTCIRRALRTRKALGATSRIEHVYSHTESDSFEALGNGQADEVANLARLEAQGAPSKPFLAGEERFTAWIEADGAQWHVIGDIRKEMTRWARRRNIDRWTVQKRQGKTASADPLATTVLCAEIRRLRSSKHLRHAVLALCEWLPSGRYHGRMMQCDIGCNDEWSCSSCSEPGQETSRHVLVCPANQEALIKAARAAATIVREHFPSCPSVWTVPAVRSSQIARLILAEGLPPEIVARCVMDVCSCSSWHELSPMAVATAVVASLTGGPQCRCDSGRCSTHGWSSPAPTVATVSSALRIDVELLGSRFRPGCTSTWFSDDLRDITSSGSPWDIAWLGLFAICAPSWTQDGRAESLFVDVCSRAAEALESPRPTRIAVIVPPALAPLCSYGPAAEADASATLPGGERLIVFQNSNAKSLAPFDIVELVHALASDTQPSPPTDRFRAWMRRCAGARLEYLPLPFWEVNSPVFVPPWVLRFPDSPAFAAFSSLARFDPYAGSLGVLPSYVSVALAAVATHSAFPPQSILRQAEDCVAKCRVVLFEGAMSAWSNSVASARQWWRVMDMDTLERKDDIGALLAHQRLRAKRIRTYDAGMMRKAVKRSLRPPAPPTDRVLRRCPAPTRVWNYLDASTVAFRIRTNLDDDYVALDGRTWVGTTATRRRRQQRRH